MKKTIFLGILLIFITLALSARELTVENFEALPTDLTARTEAVNDLNGNKCALVKVSLPVAGSDFKGNVLKQEFQVNEYYVYLSPGSKDLLVRCPGVESLMVDFRPFTDGRGLESSMTYRLRLSGYEDISGSPSRPRIKENFLILDVSPKTGVMVKIDGILQNVDNGTVSALLGIGQHELTVEASGYAPYNGIVNISAEGKTETSVVLESHHATLSVKTATPDAIIKINNSEKGRGSFSGSLAPGNYLVEVEKEGFKPYSETVTLKPKENRQLGIPALEPIYVSLYVDYKPVGSIVTIDGREVGRTPDIFREVTVGRHKVAISKEGYETYIADLNLKEDADSRLEGSLTLKSSAASSGNSTSTLNYNGHEAVDLGLSVKWATCNVGAEKPSDYGNYYAWGETKTKSTYTEINSITRNKSMKDIGGTQYDVAHTEWGGSWRLPTLEECGELFDKCKCNWEWTTLDGTYGYKVTGPNGNSIFLPAAGYRFSDSAFKDGWNGYYWSSTPVTNDINACGLFFIDRDQYLDGNGRYYGRSVRPVTE